MTWLGRDSEGRLRDFTVDQSMSVTSATDDQVLSQPMRLLGPFRVNYDDAGLDTDGVVVATLDEGTIILQAWMVVVDTFVADGLGFPHYVEITRGPGTSAVAIYQNMGAANSGDSFGNEGPADSISHRTAVATAAARDLTVLATPNTGVFTAGSLDVYALVSEPA